MDFPNRPIRVGLIGLNAPYPNDKATGTCWAAAAHPPYLKWSPKYEIVALQNSSIARAREAVQQYGLPERTRLYERPEDLASDPDIDLVVSSIRVDKHASSVIPSIKAGKSVFVEWPVESNAQKAQELTDLVKQYRVKNVVGAQGGFSMGARQLKAVINSGIIGHVRSSNMFTQTPWGGQRIPSNVDYFVDREVGGNIFTICFGHMMEVVTAVFGDVKEFSGKLVNSYPTVEIVYPGTTDVVESRQNTSPDQVMFNAILGNGVAFNFHLHTGSVRATLLTSTPGTAGAASPDLDWRILGDRGEIRVMSPTTWPLNAATEDFRIEVFVIDESTIDARQKAEVERALSQYDELEAVSLASRNTGRVYEAFAESLLGKDITYLTFEDALKKHQLAEDMYRQSKL